MPLREGRTPRIILTNLLIHQLPMKKLSVSIASSIGAVTLLMNRAYAALPDPATVTGLSSSGISAAIVAVIIAILNIILIIAVAYVVYAGIRLILSGGDEGAKDEAKKTIIYVAAGILVILLARVLVTFVNSLL